jgi:uncharacterized protein (DUF433 family)
MDHLQNYIEINPAIMLGKPVIKGTRITVETIIDELAAGYSTEQVLRAHPALSEAHVLAALQYASSLMKNEKIYLAAS